MNKNIKYISGMALALVMLTSLPACHSTKLYKSPEFASEDLFRGYSSDDTTTIANIPWREYFADANLRSLIEQGLANNPDMLIAVTRIQQSEAALSMAKAAYYPSLALVGNVDKTQISNGARGRDILGYAYNTSYMLGLSTSWELDVWGKLNRQSKARYAQLLATHAGRNLVQTNLIANIANAYYSLLALDEQLHVTKETIKLLEESTATMQALKDAGMLNQAAVEQSKALLYNTQISIPTIESQIRELENTISLLSGQMPNGIIRSSIRLQSIPEKLKAGIPVQMLAKRPDVMQAELAFRSAFEMTGVARASFYPNLSLTGMIGFTPASMSGFFSLENIAANIVGNIAQPIFAKKQLKAQYAIAQAQQQEALLTFEKAVVNAGREVSDILFRYESSLTKNELRAKQVESMTKSVEYTHELLKAGEANYTEVLNAEQNLLQSQLGQISDKLEQLQAGVSLYRALGGGVE